MSSKTRVNKISTVVIPVADQERAVDFYTHRLGFEKRVDVPFGPEEGYRWVEVAPADAVTTIAVVPPPPGGSTGNRETGIGLQTVHNIVTQAGGRVDVISAPGSGTTFRVLLPVQTQTATQQ